MNNTTNEKNRIPSELISNNDQVVSWSLPTMDSKKSRVFRSAKKEKSTNADQSTEVIEDYKGNVDGKPLTADQLKKITDEAYEEGFREGREAGFEKGHSEGIEKGTQQGKDKAYKEFSTQLIDEQMRLKTIANTLHSPMQNQDEKIENIVLDIAIRLTEELLQSEIEREPNKLFGVIKHTLDALPIGAKNIQVLLCKKDADLINSFFPETQRDWRIKINDTLKPGGCQVESDESIIDYSIETRLHNFFSEIESQESPDLDSLEPLPNYTQQESLVAAHEDKSIQSERDKQDPLHKPVSRENPIGSGALEDKTESLNDSELGQ